MNFIDTKKSYYLQCNGDACLNRYILTFHLASYEHLNLYALKDSLEDKIESQIG